METFGELVFLSTTCLSWVQTNNVRTLKARVLT